MNPASDEAGAIADRLRPLAAAPERFDLFAALRLMESAYPDHPRLGEARRARDEPVRLGQPPHLHFPPAQIAGFRAGQGAAPAMLMTYSFGLFGPQGPLPLHVTAEALSRQRHRHDPALAAFCNLFHHRFATLHYRAWANARPSVEHDRPNRDRFLARLGAIAGLPAPAATKAVPGPGSPPRVPPRFTAFTAGLFALRSRPPEAVARLVSLFFRVPARIAEFTGGWIDIPPALRTRLGRGGSAGCLGVDAVAGSRSFAPHHRVRLVLGPLDLKEFRNFLPSGNALPALGELMGLAVGWEPGWDLQLVLRRDAVPAARLDGQVQLGWTGWLSSRTRSANADDVVLAGNTQAL